MQTVISQSVDDRTPEERGLKPITAGSATKRVINKSRYDSIDSFLSLESNFKVTKLQLTSHVSLSCLSVLSRILAVG